MSVAIRLARQEDIPELRRIAIETQVDTFGAFNTPENMTAYIEQAYDPQQFTRELVEPKSAYYLAWEDGQLLGFARVRVTDEVKAYLGDNTLEIQRLYVVRASHGKGIGKLLMERCLEHARAGKFEWIWLGVWEHNVKAQQFYAAWGFERFGSHIFQMGDDPQTDWLLRRRV